MDGIVAAMNSSEKCIDNLRSSNKTAITNMFKDKRHTAPSPRAEINSRSLMKVAIEKHKIPENLRNFFSILIRHAYTRGTKSNGQLSISDVAAIYWQAIITLIDYASIICSYEMFESGVEFTIARGDLVPNEEWFI